MSEEGVDTATDLESDSHLSLRASFAVGRIHGGSSQRLRLRMEASFSRQRRSSAIRRLLEALTDGAVNERDTERVLNMRAIVSLDINLPGESTGFPLRDYFLGPGLARLLQHWAETDPNSHGTPPAQEAAVAAMPTVKIEERLSCSVCQEDFEIGADAREMPCKHKFHAYCILPWLALHSSCPVCRFQMPTEESTSSSASGNGDGVEVHGGNGDGSGGGDERGSRLPITWPFSRLSSLFGSRRRGGSSSRPSSSSTVSNS
ncbi:hypothetical protein GW17_00041721 [Ensete ventricosum]|nr:hypothetical protein GW17_00041721 [Ensete ventricosum]